MRARHWLLLAGRVSPEAGTYDGGEEGGRSDRHVGSLGGVMMMLRGDVRRGYAVVESAGRVVVVVTCVCE